MTKEELLLSIKDTLQKYKASVGIPKEPNVEKLFNLLIQGIIGDFDDAPADLSALQTQITALKDRVDALKPGISALEASSLITTALEAVNTEIAALKGKNTTQDQDITNLNQALDKKGNAADLLQLQSQVNDLSSSFDAFKSSDTAHEKAQDNTLQQLVDDFKNIPTNTTLTELQGKVDTLLGHFNTHKTEDDNRDSKQQLAIEKLIEDLKNIPTNNTLTELQGKVDTLIGNFNAHKTEDDERDTKQQASIDTLISWRNSTIQELSGIQASITGLNAVGTELERIKIDVLAPLARWQSGIDTDIANLKTQTTEIAGMLTRLATAEKNIIQLFELVKNSGKGGGSSTVNEAFVLLKVLEAENRLRTEIGLLDQKYVTLVTLSAEIGRVKSDLQAEINKKATSSDIDAAIAAAIKNLASIQALNDLGVNITTQITAAYESYFEVKWKILLGKLSDLEASIKTWTNGAIATAVQAIWSQFPDQPLPDNWLTQILIQVNEINTQEHTSIVTEIENRYETDWKPELTAEMDRRDAAQQTAWEAADEAVLQTVGDQYVLQSGLLAQIEAQIALFKATLPHFFTNEEIASIASDKANALDAKLLERIVNLENFDLDARLKKLQELHLGDFIAQINSLKLADALALLAVLDTWKSSVITDITRTKTDITNIKNDLETINEELDRRSDINTAQRLAQLVLEGWGIVQGLEILSDEDFCVNVSAGYGVRPDGQRVIVEQPKNFIGYIAMTDDRKKALDYPFFSNMPVWELIEDKYQNTIDGTLRKWLSPQSKLERDMPFISDKIILAYDDTLFVIVRSEDYLKQVDAFRRTRQLIGGERNFEDSDFVFSPSFSPVDDEPTDDNLYRALHPALTLEPIQLYRFGFRPDDDCTPEELDNTNFPALGSVENFYDTWKPIVNDALVAVNDRMETVIGNYHNLLFPQLKEQTFTVKLGVLLTNWKIYTDYAESTQGKGAQMYAQYFYDWARDLIQGYHEFRTELQDLLFEIRFDIPEALELRNRHLSLGLALRTDQDGLAAPVRDTFRQPPIYNRLASRWEKTRFYYRREIELIESFYVDMFVGKDNKRLPKRYRNEIGDAFKPNFDTLKITPGKSYKYPLGERVIPFYYPLSDSYGSLHYYWDYWRTKNRNYNQHLSYHASDGFDGYNNLDDWHVTRPLYYSLDACDFYAISGHIGRSNDLVIDGHTFSSKFIVEAINYLVAKHNLDIEVVEVLLGETVLTQAYLGPTGAPSEVMPRSFSPNYLGAEHLGGAFRGGTFIVVMHKDTNGNIVAVADFSLPYRLNGANLNPGA